MVRGWMNEKRIKKAGRLLAQAWIEQHTIPPFADAQMPRSLAEAAAVQDEMSGMIEEPIVGWKVGGAPGPLVGRIFASVLYASPALLPPGRFAKAGLECELGFRLQADLPPRAGAYGREEVADAATLVLCVEITASRFVDGPHTARDDRELFMIVADLAAQGGLVLGPEIDNWRDLDLLSISVDLRIDDGPSQPLTPRENRHDPLDVLVWLTNELSIRGIGLTAGQVVCTGSATVSQPFAPGSTAVARYGALGEIRVVIDTI
jgi:2-keto-4-pentenoate hydratase